MSILCAIFLIRFLMALNTPETHGIFLYVSGIASILGLVAGIIEYISILKQEKNR